MVFILKYSTHFVNNFSVLSKIEKKRVKDCIETIKSNPYIGKKLKVYNNVYSVRRGDLRILYQVLSNDKLIILDAVGDRKKIYNRYKQSPPESYNNLKNQL